MALKRNNNQSRGGNQNHQWNSRRNKTEHRILILTSKSLLTRINRIFVS